MLSKRDAQIDMKKRLNRTQRRRGEPITVFRDGKDNIIVDVGDLIKWNTVGGESFEGYILEMDSNVAVIKDQKTGMKQRLEI